jgi:hypothetical protein
LGDGPADASATLGPVLGHGQAQRRQVEHLPGLDPDHQRSSQVRVAAATAIRDMPDDLVGLGDLGQMGTGRAELLARPCATTALPLGRWRLGEPVR